MYSVNSYRTLLASLKPLLADYLESYGRDTSKHFVCINPEHQDDTPSCSLVPPERIQAHCFGCHINFDLPLAAHLLEGLPTSGPEFLTDNLFVLAERFGIPYDSVKLTDEDRKSVECFRAFDLANSLLEASSEASVALDIYQWDLAEIRKTVSSIGTIDWALFANKMKILGGYTQVYLETHLDITPKLFGSNLLTFALKNKSGHVIGFAARDKRYGTDSRIVKWKNTSSDVPIFNKGGFLYGIEHTLDSGPIYLVEGYTDVVRLKVAGLINVLAYCGSSITDTQAEILSRLDKTDLIIVPDRDQNGAGDKGITRSLDKVFKDFPKLRIKIKELPFNGKEKVDPGDYLKTHSLKEFLAIEDQEAFAWRLKRFPETMSSEDVYEKAMPLVCDERNPVRQQRMLHQLAEKTGVEYIQLQRFLDESIEERKRDGRKKAIRLVSQTRAQLESIDVIDAPTVLRDAADKIAEAQDRSYSAASHGPEEYASFIQELKNKYEKAGEGLLGWTTGFESFDKAFGGLPRREAMIVVAGDTNSFKTGVVQNLGLQVALKNKNTAVLIFSVDDSRGQATPRIISQMTSIPIAAVKNPNNPVYGLTVDHHKALELAWGDLKTMTNYGRLDMKDASQGTSIEFVKSWIQDTRRRHPNWDILFILDSFNKLTGFGGNEKREQIEEASDAVAKLTKQEGVTALCTAELRKRQNPRDRPYMDDVKGSNQIGYDSTIAVLIHNTMHSNPSGKKEQVESWTDPTDGLEKPVIQLHVNKNKETSYKGMFRMRARTNTSQLLEMPNQEIKDDWATDSTESVL